MKYWIHLVLIVVLGCFLGQWAPWWLVVILAIISAFLLRLKFWMAGMFGVLAGFLWWAGVAVFLDVENQHLLTNKLGPLLGGLSGLALAAVTGLIGGLLSGLGSMLGASIRQKANS